MKINIKSRLTSLIITIILFVLFGSIFCTYSGANISLLSYSNNDFNEWNYRFFYLNGEVFGFITASNDDSMLLYSSCIDDGVIEFDLYDSKGNLIRQFSSQIKSDTLKGVIKNGETYKIRAFAQKAQTGNFNFALK